MKRPTVLLILISLFTCGVVVGVAASHLFYARQLAQPGALAELSLGLVGQRLERRLDLDDEQTRQLELILEDGRREAIALRGDVVNRLLAIRGRAFERLETILTPEQRQELERLRLSGRDRIDWFIGNG